MPDMATVSITLDQQEESALAFLVQSCISDGLLLRAGCTPDMAAHLLQPITRVSDKLMALPRLSERV
jgi:hypothetical protein